MRNKGVQAKGSSLYTRGLHAKQYRPQRRRQLVIVKNQQNSPAQQSRAEQIISDLQQVDTLQQDQFTREDGQNDFAQQQQQLELCNKEAEKLQIQLDSLYNEYFSGVEFQQENGNGQPTARVLDSVTEQAFTSLGKDSPAAMNSLISSLPKDDWKAFQQKSNKLKLSLSRLTQERDQLQAQYVESVRAAAAESQNERAQESLATSSSKLEIDKPVNIVIICGFEAFNVALYKKAARAIARDCDGASVSVFSDRDIQDNPQTVETALNKADVFFGSLLVEYDTALWLLDRVQNIEYRFIFESALELMSANKVGGFSMEQKPGAGKSGPPPIVRRVLNMFNGGREEDKMVGYLSFLKLGPKLLNFIPGGRARDLRTWLTAYSYWNQGGFDNVVSMSRYLLTVLFDAKGSEPPPAQETPNTGVTHPNAPGAGYFKTPAEYMKWYNQHGPVQDEQAPVIAVLLYRKHVITQLDYIPQLITTLEHKGIKPVPIFINGVEAHTIVRDVLTSKHEQGLVRQGLNTNPTLSKDAVCVDGVVNTIGFPLVGGPAGTMEGGRQVDVAKAILTAKNIPYMVAAPLLIQDLSSWTYEGVSGLQSVALYSLPELDGAIDTVPLGGLASGNIYLSGERVYKLADRIQKWVDLKRCSKKDRKIAVLVYGFPPGVGATGTAALLNVPASLEALIKRLHDEGYDVGCDGGDIDGVALVNTLKQLEQSRVILAGKRGLSKIDIPDSLSFVEPYGEDVSAQQLTQWLSLPNDWGPNEWGPLPFLPPRDLLVKKMEANWGKLGSGRGVFITANGAARVAGLKLGNVWLGVQPLLGVEGDPMRLLFDRDLTPHPQYVATYKWIEKELQAHAMVHFGMHGTVEWLPGSPLGNTAISWSDVCLGTLPNLYLYAANNPSESVIAKRRGYGTIISHNVPPYGRSGLYKQMAQLKGLVQEYRDEEDGSPLSPTIVQLTEQAGLMKDVPFTDAAGNPVELNSDTVEGVQPEQFDAWVSKLYSYLLVVENRLYSEGLHVLGQAPDQQGVRGYLSALYESKLSEDEIDVIVSSEEDRESVVKRLERAYEMDGGGEDGGVGGNGSGGADGGQNGGAKMEAVQEALSVRELLHQNSNELDAMVSALDGHYVPPAPGGDLLRDGPGVLPTGKNMHALDPYRLPSDAAMARGKVLAQQILEQHLEENDGSYPETVSVNLWGLDCIKTKGESVGVVLTMVGAVPVREGTGRIARFNLIPLEELGRPRVDVLCNMSGIFRDTFQNVVDLLDDMFTKAAEADEAEQQNFIKKHAKDLESQGVQRTTARLFSNPAGDFGSMVNERVGAGNWDSAEELGDTWSSRNAFSYGRGTERGTARPEVLEQLLSTTDRVVQQVDSVEYGLTDIQEYYANTGALKAAVDNARGSVGSKGVKVTIIEAFGDNSKPKDLDQVLRLEYRSKLLNPKWAQAMVDQGQGGAFEISTRMTAMLGWGGTTGFQEDWTWDGAMETYVEDDEIARKLRASNPEAFRNVVKRMIEAHGRGMWDCSEDKLKRLQQEYNDIEDKLEGVE